MQHWRVPILWGWACIAKRHPSQLSSLLMESSENTEEETVVNVSSISPIHELFWLLSYLLKLFLPVLSSSWWNSSITWNTPIQISTSQFSSIRNMKRVCCLIGISVLRSHLYFIEEFSYSQYCGPANYFMNVFLVIPIHCQ